MTAPQSQDTVAAPAPDAEAEARYRAKRRRLLQAAIAAPLVILLGYLLAAHVSGGALPTLGLPLGGERGELRRITHAFWEDIQFKDFEAAARYHDAPTQEEVDIPYLIQRLFQVRPEALDIMEVEVLMVDIDSTGLRARVRSAVSVRVLGGGEAKQHEVMLYYKRSSQDAPWFMDLEDSLRRLEVAPDKKH